ncbi:MAG: substrate-binding domain-containing protein [Bryobacteraceae bacterium]
MPSSPCGSAGSRGFSGSKVNYLVGPILRACRILKSFNFDGEAIPLRELVARTGLNKTTAFRAAESLVAGGLLERIAVDRYRVVVVSNGKKRLRLGYAAMTSQSLFGQVVTKSIREAAVATETELIEVDNQLSERIALSNCRRLIREGVELAIEFQVCHRVAGAVASEFASVGIPMIAVHTPHPGAIFFGGNNHAAGRIAGRALAAWAAKEWQSAVDVVLLLGHAAAGSLTNSRLTGVIAGISEALPRPNALATIRLDCKGGYAETVEILLKYLAHSTAKRFLVGAINDAVALGALRAFSEAGRSEECAVMGQNGTIAARMELRKSGSRLIGSVGFFPERYGPHLMRLASDILRQKPKAPATFVRHVLITAENVNKHYPNDVLPSALDADSLLFYRYH